MPNYILATGFETREELDFSWINKPYSTGIVGSGRPFSGSYAIGFNYNYGQAAGVYVRFRNSASVSEAWMNVAVRTPSMTNFRVGLYGTAGTYYVVASGGVMTLTGYGGTLNSTISTLSNNQWHRYEIHIKVDNTVGVAEFRIDGSSLFTFNGDTQPGAGTTLERAYIYGNPGNIGAQWGYTDDLSVADDGFPDDLRYVALLPTSDYSTQLTPSSGSDNYAMVDERPPSTSDFVYSDVDGYRDLYGHTAFDDLGGRKSPKVVAQYTSGFKDTTDPGTIRHIVNDGTYEDLGSAEDLETSAATHDRILNQGPDGNPWTTTEVNACKIGVEVGL